MILLETALFLCIVLGIAWAIIDSLLKNEEQERLKTTFYNLLHDQNSQISLIQLAVAAKVEAKIARKYLEHQAKVLSATVEVDLDGNTYYKFPKLQLPTPD